MSSSISPVNKYQLVREALRQRITQQWEAGSQIPSQSSLMKEFNASYSTITRAVSDLRQEGLLIAEQGKGTFVASREHKLKQQAAATIGLAVHLADWPFMERILAGFYEGASKADYRVAVPQLAPPHFQARETNEHQRQLEVERVRELLNRGVDGIVMTSAATTKNAAVKLVREAGIPLLFLQPVDDPQLDCVTIDDVAAGACVTQHLIDQKFTRIAFTGSAEEATTVYGQRRLDGYHQTMKKAGLSPRFIAMPSLSRDHLGRADLDGDRTTLDMLAREFDAVATWSDQIAIMLLTRLRLAGYDVPGDLAIAGFNDSPLCAELSIDLTSLRQPSRSLGREAFQIIRTKIENPKLVSMPMQRVLPFELKVRGSTAPRMPSNVEVLRRPVN